LSKTGFPRRYFGQASDAFKPAYCPGLVPEPF
jgi:hypothetical protein